jgi:hypothetical protein
MGTNREIHTHSPHTEAAGPIHNGVCKPVRVNVSVPDPLFEQVRENLPDLNVSGVLQDALRALLDCDHDRLVCACCDSPVSSDEVATTAQDRLYRALLAAWEPLVDSHGTAVGAATVAKRVALEVGVPAADSLPLPRPARSMREAS